MYDAVYVYDGSGSFLGYAIKEQGTPKLDSATLYTEEEQDKLNDQLGRLNDAYLVKAHWPDAKDPEVQAVLADPDFEPLEMMEDDVLDVENSYIVYEKEPDGSDSLDIDKMASVLVFKKEMVPKYVSAVWERTKNAQEVVARQRMVC